MIARPRKLDLIEARPSVCGGAACIAGTRIPIWMLYEAHLAGLTDEKILDMHRSLSPIQLAAAWEYARAHEQELQGHIRENREG